MKKGTVLHKMKKNLKTEEGRLEFLTVLTTYNNIRDRIEGLLLIIDKYIDRGGPIYSFLMQNLRSELKAIAWANDLKDTKTNDQVIDKAVEYYMSKI